MNAKILIWIFCLALGSVQALAQAPFLPQRLNTGDNDHPYTFLEHNGAYYFAGTQWPIRSGGASTGFCYKTDSVGNLLGQFSLSGLDSQRAYTCEAIFGFRDQLYMIATTGPFRSVAFPLPPGPGRQDDCYDYNRLLVLRLDENLTLRRTDTLKVGTDAADLSRVQAVLVGGKLIIGYSLFDHWSSKSGLAIYSPDSGFIRQQALNPSFLSPFPYNDSNVIHNLTPSGSSQFVLSGSFARGGGQKAEAHVLRLDTNLAITERFTAAPHFVSNPAASEFHKWYIEAWKPTDNGPYFLGPVFNYGLMVGPAHYGFSLGRLSQNHDTVYLAPSPPTTHTAVVNGAQPAYKKPMTWLRDKSGFVISGTNYDIDTGSNLVPYLRVIRYDTALSVRWYRDFGNTNLRFSPFGVHELGNGRLMVLAASWNRPNGDISMNLHCFILDTNGTPLRNFMVDAAAGAVKIYPNPAQNILQLELPEGQGSSRYRMVDLQGRVVLEGRYTAGESISVAALAPAHYVCQVQLPSGSWHSQLFTKE